MTALDGGFAPTASLEREWCAPAHGAKHYARLPPRSLRRGAALAAEVAMQQLSVPLYLRNGCCRRLAPRARARESACTNGRGKVTADRWFGATVLPQLHVLAWGNKRGV